ncbi:thioesterase domain-containing protein [Roseixanthobacter glucoisosaccharinicivorans]|uniref:thioesterase domain-containing protein n=1 Tax=Roseixanthobacter glucoisosaccharinicivorans TaxID=3119923 RepID=UPI00372B2DE7
MTSRPRFVLSLLAAFCVLISTAVVPAHAQNGNVRVYLMRGLANVFSLGMDDLAGKLQAKGISATVYEYGQWPQLAEDAVEWSKAHRKAPVVIIGHSLGADAAIEMAERMTALGVPPRLVVTFDPVGVTAVANTGGRFVNYFQNNNGFGKSLAIGAGFKGSLANRNLDNTASLDHFNIEKSPTLHAEVIKMIQALAVRPKPKPVAPPSQPAPSVTPSPSMAAPATSDRAESTVATAPQLVR